MGPETGLNVAHLNSLSWTYLRHRSSEFASELMCDR